MASQTFVGTVASFNSMKGWGFIECDQTKAMYGSDIFLLKSALSGYAVNKGDQVSFQVTQGPKGTQAAEVQVLVGSPDQQSFFGEVKTFNAAKGYGFISGAASEQVYGKDIFVMRSDLGPVAAPGMKVMYKVKPGDRGPVACEVQVINGGNGAGAGAAQWGAWSPAAQWGGTQWGAPGWGPQQQQVWGGAGGWGGAVAMGGPRAPSEKEVFYGTLKAVSEEKGWGHIGCEAIKRIYQKDLFVMKTNLENSGLVVGQEVAFSVQQGPKGPHAVNLQPFNSPPVDTVYTGVVKSFNESKGWGFVESEMSRSIFYTDIFLHTKEMGGSMCNPGDQVQYTVELQGGRAVAKNVQVFASAAGGAQLGGAARAKPY